MKVGVWHTVDFRRLSVGCTFIGLKYVGLVALGVVTIGYPSKPGGVTY